jgi:hypothetical protein
VHHIEELVLACRTGTGTHGEGYDGPVVEIDVLSIHFTGVTVVQADTIITTLAPALV